MAPHMKNRTCFLPSDQCSFEVWAVKVELVGLQVGYVWKEHRKECVSKETGLLSSPNDFSALN